MVFQFGQENLNWIYFKTVLKFGQESLNWIYFKIALKFGQQKFRFNLFLNCIEIWARKMKFNVLKNCISLWARKLKFHLFKDFTEIWPSCLCWKRLPPPPDFGSSHLQTLSSWASSSTTLIYLSKKRRIFHVDFYFYTFPANSRFISQRSEEKKNQNLSGVNKDGNILTWLNSSSRAHPDLCHPVPHKAALPNQIILNQAP